MSGKNRTGLLVEFHDDRRFGLIELVRPDTFEPDLGKGNRRTRARRYVVLASAFDDAEIEPVVGKVYRFTTGKGHGQTIAATVMPIEDTTSAREMLAQHSD